MMWSRTDWLVFKCRIPRLKTSSWASDSSQSENCSCSQDTRKFLLKQNIQYITCLSVSMSCQTFDPSHTELQDTAVYKISRIQPITHIQSQKKTEIINCPSTKVCQHLSWWRAVTLKLTYVSSNLSSYGWFNTALMVEGKTYLPWLMEWWVINFSLKLYQLFPLPRLNTWTHFILFATSFITQ